jgi:RimJ/RimL family protein N-acetyltransferase
VDLVEIRADGLHLRPWRPADAAAVQRACQDPGVRAWTGGAATVTGRSPGDGAAELPGDGAAGPPGDGAAIRLGVFDTGGGLLGGVTLHGLDRRQRTAELGYWTAPWARGRRVAERASRALLGWAFAHLDLVRVDWRAAVGNHASRLTGLRLGFHPIGVRPGPAEEWVATLRPGDLGEHRLPEVVQRQARVFGGERPTLAAGAVTLRPPRDDDRDAIEAACADPEIIRWFGVPQPYTGEHARRYVHEEAPAEWARGTEAIFVIADRADAYAGAVDLRVTPHDPAAGEVGFLVAPQARGRGYAVAALSALARWGFIELGLRRIQWRAEVGNHASRRVAERAGFTMEGLLRQALTSDGRRYDCWVGSLLSSERVAV